jgi:hypothetical protein
MNAPPSLSSDTALIVNISTQIWPPRHRTYFGSLVVRSPENGAPYAVTPVHSCKGVMDLGDKRTMEFSITAREIAEDIARELNNDSGDGSFHGVFVAGGSEPTQAELTGARHRLSGFYTKLVAAADLEWERSHNPMFITDLDRRAARELKLDKPWLYDPKPQDECPACAEKIKPGVAVCRSCGAILNREKAAQFGLVPADSSVAQPLLPALRDDGAVRGVSHSQAAAESGKSATETQSHREK